MELIKGLAVGFLTGYLGYLASKILRVPKLTDSNFKFVMVVRSDKNLSKGDIARYCSKAALECYIEANKSCNEGVTRWSRNGQPKIVLKTKEKGNEELLRLQKQAGKIDLVSVSIKEDSGNDYVVIGVGPGPESLIDEVTGSLKLL